MARKKSPEPTFMNAKKSLFDTKEMTKLYNKLDSFQLQYYDAMQKYSVVCVNAPSGGGKTTVAVLKAFQMLDNGEISKIMYLRFPSERSNKLGFLPGEKSEKEAILMTPFFNACVECGIQLEQVYRMIEDETLVLTSDSSLRGTNIKNTFLIIDESQSATISDLQLALTRVHNDSKCVLIGHVGQLDSKVKMYSGLCPFEVYIKHMTQKPFAVSCDLPINYRGSISTWADEINVTLESLKPPKQSFISKIYSRITRVLR